MKAKDDVFGEKEVGNKQEVQRKGRDPLSCPKADVGFHDLTSLSRSVFHLHVANIRIVDDALHRHQESVHRCPLRNDLLRVLGDLE